MSEEFNDELDTIERESMTLATLFEWDLSGIKVAENAILCAKAGARAELQSWIDDVGALEAENARLRAKLEVSSARLSEADAALISLRDNTAAFLRLEDSEDEDKGWDALSRVSEAFNQVSAYFSKWNEKPGLTATVERDANGVEYLRVDEVKE